MGDLAVTVTTRTSPTGDRGFTLIELLTVLAVLSLVMMLVVPRFSSGSGQTDLLAAGQRLAAALQATRTAAMMEGRPATLSIDIEQRRFTGPSDLATGILPPDVDVTVLADFGDLLSNQQANLRFFPDGTSTGGRVVLTGDSGSVRVAIQWLTGRVTVDGLMEE